VGPVPFAFCPPSALRCGWPDLDTITDDLEREATVGIIHNCQSHSLVSLYLVLPCVTVGQTPRKIFWTPHPPRLMAGPVTLPLGSLVGVAEDPHLLLQDSKPVKGVLILYAYRLAHRIGRPRTTQCCSRARHRLGQRTNSTLSRRCSMFALPPP
jgi:hypothetical protein